MLRSAINSLEERALVLFDELVGHIDVGQLSSVVLDEIEQWSCEKSPSIAFASDIHPETCCEEDVGSKSEVRVLFCDVLSTSATEPVEILCQRGWVVHCKGAECLYRRGLCSCEPELASQQSLLSRRNLEARSLECLEYQSSNQAANRA